MSIVFLVSLDGVGTLSQRYSSRRIVLTTSSTSLIPNLSYISEAAACVLDRQLHTFLVPHTELVWLSSKSFHYDYWDRRAFYRKRKPLPPKVGSFQAFLTGYEGKC